MAEDTQAPASEAPAAAAPEVAAAPAKEQKEAGKDTAAPPPPAPEAEEELKKPEVTGEAEREKPVIPQSASFKEESNVVAELEDLQKKALDELKQLVQAALANNEFTAPPPPPPPVPKEEKPAEPTETEEPAAAAPMAEVVAAEPPECKEPDGATSEPAAAPSSSEPPTTEKPAAVEPPAEVADEATMAETVTEEKAAVSADGAKTVEAIAESVVAAVATTAAEPIVSEEEDQSSKPAAQEVSLWGVPLLRGAESDTVLLKFLRARDFKAKDALAMLKGAVIWREEFGIEGLLAEEDVGMAELEKAVFMHGHDREGHPVCYNVYGQFQDRELYQKVFSDGEKRRRFLRWRIQVLEKGIRRHLDFGPRGVSSMVQVTDLRGSPVVGKKELRQATKQALHLLQDNYPELVAKQVFVNVPWWYLAFNRMISPFLTQRSRSKFVFAGPSKSSDALFRYIAPEQVPVQYGGLSKEDDADFTTSDAVAEVTVKPAAKHAVEISVSENCVLVWELRVLGWDVTYGAEFVPGAEDGYTVVVQKSRKLAPAADEPLVKNSFKIGEPGKVILNVENCSSSKKKKLLYRYKTLSAANLS